MTIWNLGDKETDAMESSIWPASMQRSTDAARAPDHQRPPSTQFSVLSNPSFQGCLDPNRPTIGIDAFTLPRKKQAGSNPYGLSGGHIDGVSAEHWATEIRAFKAEKPPLRKLNTYKPEHLFDFIKTPT